MNPPQRDDLSHLSMLELFRAEAESQTAQLNSGLLELERGGGRPESFEVLMRAAHSLKGAARIVNLDAAVRVTHALEDCFVAAQAAHLRLLPPQMDLLLRGVDLLAQLARRADVNPADWGNRQETEINELIRALGIFVTEARAALPALSPAPDTPAPLAGVQQTATSFDAEGASIIPVARTDGLQKKALPPPAIRKLEPAERILRLTAENLNRLLALAGESLVESRWLRPFADSLHQLKRQQSDLEQELDRLANALQHDGLSERARKDCIGLRASMAECQRFLAERMQELDMFGRRSAHLSQRLYQEVLRTRMRPFSDGVRRFPRMVRDLARSLNKEVRLEILGETTQVDRDILERLETPLAHLLRNAVDHGCEEPAARCAAGKPVECLLHLEARHSAGVLLVTVADDGGGVDPERVRRAVVQKTLATPAAAARLTESELLEFLFIPGFTLKESVTEISGRGFGLDVVENMVKSVRGTIRINNQPGHGLRVQLQLPLTLSVLRTLLVEVAGEPYAIPLSQIVRALTVPQAGIGVLERRSFFRFGEQHVGLAAARQLFECGAPAAPAQELQVVVLADRGTRYGLIVDRFLGERELVVQPLDPRLGKVRDISAAALTEDGSPVLIVDVEDVLRSIEKLFADGRPALPPPIRLDPSGSRPKRVLAVDDSLTVRELERKLLTGHGYLADVAVDGLEAWDALRTQDYDLVITDVDMPRLNGIELAALIKQDQRLKSLPVMIVSYKEGDLERMRGLQAGADFYLAKGSFHEQMLVQAVIQLIGEPLSTPATTSITEPKCE